MLKAAGFFVQTAGLDDDIGDIECRFGDPIPSASGGVLPGLFALGRRGAKPVRRPLPHDSDAVHHHADLHR